jgi:hypothetical protein
MNSKVKRLDYYEINNKIYADCYFLPNKYIKDEIKYARWLSKYFNSDVYLVPQVKTNGVRTPDYWVERTNCYWDLKMINGNYKDIIDKIMKKSKEQTSRLLIRINESRLPVNYLREYVISKFKRYERMHIKEIILVDSNSRLIIHVKRK